ncbi:negative regulator of flagellin synthesis FlgM [Anoxybacillus voinovskiensis]|uniref:Negative regulator of flagellin synthesis n=1 Tax=Anoxybacteroides voinovskiense TaxID=230470 RepID=A0A840DKF1_9BACL|nr:flagellar biosynthesis anti-sigma factor FlgM [Anoxybacillus voinovskiensis]MBB4073761.1 negative regulator of flagellin synthesis FlgM [Anoxybacillus voinovskiensis]GGJ64131.1 negative regulator of flagellin synthesis [Anoxybacillus voinovskiensis]
MNIHRIGSTNVNPYQRQMNKLEQSAKTTGKKDKVEISQAAKELQEASKLEAARQEKVEQLKQQVQTGTYTVDAKAVAESVWNYYFNK